AIIDTRCFQFDFVFEANDSQECVYQSCAFPIVDKLFEGYNCTILAYGQTGSGKTYTMGSEETVQDLVRPTAGIIPRMVQDIFRNIERSSEFCFRLSCSMLEIYNENVRDLLGRRDALQIREDVQQGIFIKNLTEIPVQSLKDTLICLEEGCRNRSQAQTAMNLKSSRSHAIFILNLNKTAADESTSVKARLNLVDLAGSERLKKTLAEGDRLKEGIKINEGLLALGNVIAALIDHSSTKAHIPYRDSKLTRLLQGTINYETSLTI
ncbi:unnamed protein product, partial [Soboliphyme baturini]|uniref:Kinesin-like protein n=1 Tax=Soboliphyme baturini TaxID=241478 RepID=A0A183J9Q2_9BILA